MDLARIVNTFPFPWSHYVKMLSLDDEKARKFYERTLLSNNKANILQKGTEPQVGDLVTPILARVARR